MPLRRAPAHRRPETAGTNRAVTAAVPVRERETKASPSTLKGRRAIGSLPKPAYESNDAQGIVIIEITVDAQGRVQNTAFHPQGSTTQDARLLDAALQAARQARFSPSEANAVQTGTITYVFRLQ